MSNRAKAPKYRLHRASGQAVVTLNGRSVYLGKHNTVESKSAYACVIGEWRAGVGLGPIEKDTFTVVELIAAYVEFSHGYYRSAVVTHQDGSKTGGNLTKEFEDVCRAMRPLKKLYGPTFAKDFGPRCFIAVRQAVIVEGLARMTVNKIMGRIRRMFRWGVEYELIAPDVLVGLKAVRDLKAGRCAAPEFEAVKPVAESVVAETLKHLPSTVADLLRVQMLTGARSGEIVIMRQCDIDTSGPVWSFKPYSHKTAYRKHERIILLGPEAKEIVKRYFTTNLMAYLFSPKASEVKRLAENHAKRVTPMSCGNRPGTNRRKGARPVGDLYHTAALGRAVRRACEKVFPIPDGLSEREAEMWKKAHWWHPHQLRHTAAERFRKQSGLVVAGILLGHKSLVTTERYASPDVSAASELIARNG